MQAFGYESISVAGSAVGFDTGELVADSTVPAQQALVTVEVAPCRFRIDGVADPTTDEGHLLEIGDTVTITGVQNLHNFRAIRDTDISAMLRVTYLH